MVLQIAICPEALATALRAGVGLFVPVNPHVDFEIRNQVELFATPREAAKIRAS